MAKTEASQGNARRTVPQSSSRLAPVLERNIEALFARRQRETEAAPWQERVASVIANFIGTMAFMYIQGAIFFFWVIANLGWILFIHPWDKSFILLGTIASVEAIFLTTFVLITQNRMTRAADKRADLDLQISLLTEHEITKLTTLVSEIAQELDVKTHVDHELEEIKRDVAPEIVLDKIDKKTMTDE